MSGTHSPEVSGKLREELEAFAHEVNESCASYIASQAGRTCCGPHAIENTVAALLSVSMALLQMIGDRREGENFVQDFMDGTRAMAMRLEGSLPRSGAAS